MATTKNAATKLLEVKKVLEDLGIENTVKYDKDGVNFCITSLVDNFDSILEKLATDKRFKYTGRTFFSGGFGYINFSFK